jgi:signal transduction histidine kinase
LGLSTVQGFVSQSSGSLKIISESNRGTTVSLWLPSVGASHE